MRNRQLIGFDFRLDCFGIGVVVTRKIGLFICIGPLLINVLGRKANNERPNP